MEGRVDHGRGVTGPPGPAGPALALRVPGGAAAGSRPCRTELPLGPLLGRGPSGRPGDAPAVPAGPLRKAPVRVPRVRHPCGPRGASSCVSAPPTELQTRGAPRARLRPVVCAPGPAARGVVPTLRRPRVTQSRSEAQPLGPQPGTTVQNPRILAVAWGSQAHSGPRSPGLGNSSAFLSDQQ